MERGLAHVLATPRPRLPFRQLPSILEMRLKDINKASPRMCVNHSAVRGLAAGPDFGRRQVSREHVRGLIVEMSSGTSKGKDPHITFTMLRPSEGGVDHHFGASSADGGFDTILGNGIMMMRAQAAVIDPLTFGEELSTKFLGGIITIVGSVALDKNADRGSFALKLKLGLDRFGARKPGLVDDGDLLPASRVTEQSPSMKLLRGERVSSSGELTAFKARFILIRENEVSWFQLV
jgi:hypothetical protein